MPKPRSRTDWERVKREAASEAPIAFDAGDGPYDPDDEESVEAFWKAAKRTRGPQKAPTKILTSIRLSREVVEHFRRSGPGWQTRVDEVLRRHVRRAK